MTIEYSARPGAAAQLISGGVRTPEKGDIMDIDNSFGMKYFPIITVGSTLETDESSGERPHERPMDADGGAAPSYMPDIPLPRFIEASTAPDDPNKGNGFKRTLISTRA
ncbi:MAG: hypothetical protein GY859_25470 [Desulfobacterales bacterium]|nr:hypothetical protein [Desulfobacterales bacterium]